MFRVKAKVLKMAGKNLLLVLIVAIITAILQSFSFTSLGSL